VLFVIALLAQIGSFRPRGVGRVETPSMGAAYFAGLRAVGAAVAHYVGMLSIMDELCKRAEGMSHCLFYGHEGRLESTKISSKMCMSMKSKYQCC
jgi:hypothetical protein